MRSGPVVPMQLTREGGKPPKEWTGRPEDAPKTRSAWAIRQGKYVVDADLWRTVTSNEMGAVDSPTKKRRKKASRVPKDRAEQASSLPKPSQDETAVVPATEAGSPTEPSQLCIRVRRAQRGLFAHV